MRQEKTIAILANTIVIKAETFNLVLKALQNAQDGNPCSLFEDALNALKSELQMIESRIGRAIV